MDFTTTFFIDLLSSCLILTFAFLNPLIEKVKCRLYVLLFAILFVAELIQQQYNLSAACIIGLELIYILIITKNRVYNCILALFSYFMIVVLNNLSLLGLQKFFNISVERLSTSIEIELVFYIYFTVIVFGSTWLVGHYVRRFFRPEKLNQYQKVIFLVLLEVMLAAAVLIFNIDYGNQIGYPNDTILFNCILFCLYFVLSTLLLLNLVSTTRKNIEAEQKEIEYHQLLDYIEDLEQTSNTLRHFQHDYLNTLTAMDIMIHTGSRESLIAYFDKNVKPEGMSLSRVKTDLARLSHIADPAVKGIISHKLQTARMKEISTQLDVMEDINHLDIEPFDLARILGIFLDNAIEAASVLPEPSIRVAFLPMDNYLTILVSNTCSSDSIPMDSITKEGFSTKGKNRGLGLHHVDVILSRYSNIYHCTQQKDGLFSQVLEVYPKKS